LFSIINALVEDCLSNLTRWTMVTAFTRASYNTETIIRSVSAALRGFIDQYDMHMNAKIKDGYIVGYAPD